VEYFWRFFRLALFAAVFAGLILGPVGWLRTLYLKHANEKYVEAAYDFRFALTLIVLLLIAVALRLWFDVAEVYVVQMADGDRRVRRSLGPSLRLCRGTSAISFSATSLPALSACSASPSSCGSGPSARLSSHRACLLLEPDRLAVPARLPHLAASHCHHPGARQ